MALSNAPLSPEARPLAIRLRSTRLRRAGGQHPRQGDIVLRAHVIAKLLGLRLLTLDAEVLIDSYSDSPIAPAETESAAAQKLGEISPPARRVGGSTGGLGQATELLEQSDAVLTSCVRHRGTQTAR
jgi:hypothetical protein